MSSTGSVAVFGGCGFIGSALVRKLVKLGVDRVHVVDDLSSGREYLLPDSDRVGFIRANAATFDLTGLGPLDCAYYLCAAPFVPDSFRNPDLTKHANVEVLHKFLVKNRHSMPSRMIYASSGEVYGEVIEPCAAEVDDIPDVVATDSPYRASRVAAENIFRNEVESLSTAAVALRVFNVIGPNSTQPYFVPEMVRQLLAGSDILHGNLESVRDFVWIEDTVDAFVAAKDADMGAGFTAVNVASGIGWTMKEILDMLVDVTARTDVRIKHDLDRARPFDLQRLVGCTERARRLLGWSARRSVRLALEDTVRAYTMSGAWPYES